MNSIHIKEIRLDLEPDNGEINIGHYITTSEMKGFMKLSDQKTEFRIGLNVSGDSVNVLGRKIVGYDRAGLLFEPILDDNNNPVFQKLPQVRFTSSDGKPSEEFKYYADIKRGSNMKDLKSKNQILIPSIGLN